jgi:hypothetical protein
LVSVLDARRNSDLRLDRKSPWHLRIPEMGLGGYALPQVDPMQDQMALDRRTPFALHDFSAAFPSACRGTAPVVFGLSAA